MANMEDEEMMDVDAGADTSRPTGPGYGLSGPDEGSAYRSDADSSSYAHHPATQGYNEYSVGQEEAQQQRNQRQQHGGRRLSQQRARSMGHAVELDNGGSGNNSRSGSMAAHPNPQRGRYQRQGSQVPLRIMPGARVTGITQVVMWLHVRGASGQKKPIQSAHNVEHVKPLVQQWQPHRVNLTGQRQGA